MNEKDALAWGNTELQKMGLSGMMRFRGGTHSGGQTCIELICEEGYPGWVDGHMIDYPEGLLLDYEFAESPRAAVGRILLRVRMNHK